MTSSIRSPFQPWPKATVFAQVPTLPVVPLPEPEEDIASWLQAIAEIYGLSLTAYLTHLGTPRVAAGTRIAEELILNPSEKLLACIQRDTGLHRDRLTAMTFIGLDPDLASAALNHDTPCPTCTAAAAAAARAGRPLSLLGARAAWRMMVCPLHPPFPRTDEIAPGMDLAPVNVRIREIQSILDRAAFDPDILGGYMPTIRPAVSAGTVVHFAYLLNSFLQVRLEAYDTLRDLAVYQVVRSYEPVQRGRPSSLPLEARNDRALSLLLAWQLLSLPTWSLLVGLRLHPEAAEVEPATTARAVFDMLLDVWPGELLSRFVVGLGFDDPKGTLNPERLTRLSTFLTFPYSNQPDFEAIRRVASEQHAAFVRHLFSDGVIRRPQATYSRFEVNSPVLYRMIPAGGRSAAAVASLRRAAWKQRVWKQNLRKLQARAPLPARPKTHEQPLKIVSATMIKTAVGRALLEVGPMPARRTAKQRRRHWQMLVKAGMEALSHLGQEGDL